MGEVLVEAYGASKFFRRVLKALWNALTFPARVMWKVLTWRLKR